MSYLINKTNGQLVLTLLDGTADGPLINPGLNTTDLNFYGKNYPTYGEGQNENFIRLLENFANKTPPSTPIKGELWYDTSTNFLKIYGGNTWTPVSPTIVSNTQPTVIGTTVVNGTHWWDTTNDQMFSYNSNGWTLIGPPYSKLDGKSGAFPENVYDTNGTKHTIVKVYTNGNVSSIASYDTTFTPNVEIVGFPQINTGWTINTAISGEFVGTATNSLDLGGSPASTYARKDRDETFAGNLSIASEHLQINSSPTGDVSISNTVSNSNINLNVNVSGSTIKVVTVNGVTGTLQVSAVPNVANDVTNKSYVDASIAVAVAPLAPKDSPIFIGIPRAPTASFGDSSSQIATTAFVASAVAPLAPLDSPQLIGVPTSPTAAFGTNTTQVATTEFVQTAIAAQQFHYTVSTGAPSGGNDGDFWFQIQG
jgi:hypothetical protein